MAIHIRFYTPKVIRIENACNQLRSAEYAVREVGEYACDGQLPVVDIEHLAHRRFFAEERFGERAVDDDTVPSRQHVTGIALNIWKNDESTQSTATCIYSSPIRNVLFS